MPKKKTDNTEELPTSKEPQKTSTALTDAGAVAYKPVQGITTVAQWCQSSSALAEVEKNIPANSGVTNERFLRLLWTAIQKTPKILNCTIQSVSSCAYDMVALDLSPGSLFAEAHLIPFKDQCTLILGWKGLMKLVIRGGAVKRFETCIVYEGEPFSLTRGLHPDLVHTPDIDPKKRVLDKIVGAYSIAVYHDGDREFNFMTRKEMDKTGDAAIAKAKGRNTPWTTHKEEMYKKTVIRNHCKMFPMPAEQQQAVFQDAENERTGHQAIDVSATVVQPEEAAPETIEDVTKQIESKAAEETEDGLCKMCHEEEAGPDGNCRKCQDIINNPS